MNRIPESAQSMPRVTAAWQRPPVPAPRTAQPAHVARDAAKPAHVAMYETTMARFAEMHQEWARAMRYVRLIVVTADYHMPRAMLELNAVLRGTGIQAQTYAVATPALKAKDWWRSPGAARLMVVEYCKYLAILGLEAVLGLGPREKPAAQLKG